MITEALAAVRRDAEFRGDEAAMHVSDLYSCDRQTWYRRNGFMQPEKSDALLRKFDVGNAVEHRIISQLRAAGHKVMSDFEVRLNDDMIGHPDAVVDDTLLEIKTSDVRKIAAEASLHYAIQAAAYAIALGLDRAIVHVTHVANFDKDEAEYEIDVDAWRARVQERYEAVALTGPGTPPPDPVPPAESAAFACKYCAWSQCERNPNYEGDPTW